MIEVLIDKLLALNINIELIEEDKLKIHTDISKIPAALLAEIKLAKQDLVKYLKENRTSSSFQEIPNAPQQQNYPLSSSQKRLWLLSQLADGNVAYNIPGTYVFEGELDVKALEHTLFTLLGRHEILCTVFKEDETGEVRQFINTVGNTGFTLKQFDLRQSATSIDALLLEEMVKPFNLANGPLLRTTLYRLADNKWIFSYVMHHIISDAWSMDILIKELFQIYNKDTNHLKPLRIQYKDYATWQQAQLSVDESKKHRAYWLNQFAGELPVLDMQGDKPRPAIQTFNGERISKSLGLQVSKGILELSQEQGSTLFMTLLAAVNALLYKYTNQVDIVIGSPTAGREHTDLENQIGFYINTLALRSQFKAGDSFEALLNTVKEVTLQAYEHQAYPFDQLVDELQLRRDRSRNALFDVAMTLQTGSTMQTNGSMNMDKLQVSRYHGKGNLICKFDLLFVFVQSGEELFVNIEYNKDIYTKATAERLAGNLTKLLDNIIRYPGKPINELDCLNEVEKQQLLSGFNNTGTTYPDKTIVRLFEEQAAANPDLTAVVSGDTKLTYRELDEKSNQLAHYLRKHYDVQPDQLIGIMLDRSDKLIISILGILKAGAAYVPIDVSYPLPRKEFIIRETALNVLITQADFMFDLVCYTGNLLAIDIQLDTLDTPVSSCGVMVAPDSLAYVIYTSGSTGNPKGVMIEHTTIANTIFSQKEIFDIQVAERGLQFASASFDASVSEIFIILTAGGTLYIINDADKKDPELLLQFINDSEISIATIPPAFLQLMEIEKIQTLKKLITAGEAAIKNSVDSYSSIGDYFNAYGPTESSICATVLKINKGTITDNKNVPIGSPIANTQIYILNDGLDMVPVGVAGEICIGGGGLARGYLHNEQLTDLKFANNPFKAGTRIYKTGDLGRWLPDGNIEFLGRKDNQVKINGYRIELDEIPFVLLNEKIVKEAVAAVKQDSGGNKDLVLYYVPDEETGYTANKIAENKEKGLPGRAVLFPLQNGLSAYAYNKSEVELLFEEIFTDSVYIKYGITIPDNACVVDIGANIGMFSVYANKVAKGVKVYAFEPLPPIYSLLELNASLYPGDINIFNIGISNKAETASFTYFPGSTALSSRYAETENVKDTVRKFIHNKEQAKEEDVTASELDELLENHLQHQQFECKLETLSQVIAANNIERIDLLKIDVEKGEWDVLQGITDEDWKKIRQVVLEIHDINNRLELINTLLVKHGFNTFIDQPADLLGTELYNVYAIHADVVAGETPAVPEFYSPEKLKERIRNTLAAHLPSYMMPGHFMQLTALPLTASGKVDKKKLPAPETEQGMSNAYTAPGNEAEQQLVAVFEEVLKKHPIGIQDDFFGLGGDSIKSIQIVSRLKQRGYTLTIQDVMSYPVIAALAERVSLVSRTTDQGLVEGIIPMTPVQAAFFQSGIIDKHHFNQSVLLYSRESLSTAGLTAALDKLVLHHDALRMVYRESDAGWIQENKGADQGYTLEIIEDDQFITHCERIQSTINLTDGPLFRVALFRGASGDRLMMVAHHLVVDAVSWRIIFEDLSDLYQQYLAGESLLLPLKTDSFRYWQEKQSAYALSETLLAEDKYWSSVESLMIEPLPVDYPEGSNSMKDIASTAFTLDEEATTRLLTQCYKAYHTEINDILLTGLSLALNDVFNLDNVLVRLEGHGREDIGTDADITRTVGWFTTTYPVVFDMRYSDDITRQLIEVKESLHRVPNKGIGYGILRYLAGKPYTLNPQVSFNYLGDFGSGVETKQGDQIFEFSGEYHGKGFSENMQREGVLEISGKVIQGRIRLAIGYSKQQYDAATVRELTQAYQQRLEALIEVLSTEADVHLSPVDLTYKDLSIDQLEKLNKLLC
ncbi:methyltransferase, FkbM family/non-ribosomal peptide synthase domain TIGR01720/amino acid adenylation domain-containing protein [Chitinophaga sp. CF118]|uniref:non-ribosomal peptide synthetase n=1 Tax=Chitinophaga sp. CF118 TaxID=1884367 RepID=UPI0008DF6BEF|nr:non-ribosomal peptide synthetase [Chitinophaga sp. CF118]SFF10403.1 methyltransferase, FkbM family/non-ribosomal peptide synthase domain TIGR01720/amino acid adenylation domain-containing protein [Chitinophaga sp. CF118]